MRGKKRLDPSLRFRNPSLLKDRQSEMFRIDADIRPVDDVAKREG